MAEKVLAIIAKQDMFTVFSASGSRTCKGRRGASLVKSAVFFCFQGVHFGDALILAKLAGVSAT